MRLWRCLCLLLALNAGAIDCARAQNADLERMLDRVDPQPPIRQVQPSGGAMPNQLPNQLQGLKSGYGNMPNQNSGFAGFRPQQQGMQMGSFPSKARRSTGFGPRDLLRVLLEGDSGSGSDKESQKRQSDQRKYNNANSYLSTARDQESRALNAESRSRYGDKGSRQSAANEARYAANAARAAANNATSAAAGGALAGNEAAASARASADRAEAAADRASYNAATAN